MAKATGAQGRKKRLAHPGLLAAEKVFHPPAVGIIFSEGNRASNHSSLGRAFATGFFIRF